MRYLIITAMAVALGALAAHAQTSSWMDAVRQCAAEINQQQPCPTSCTNRLWPRYVACANDRLGDPISKSALNACIAAVRGRQQVTHPCEACWNPDEEVAECAFGK